MSGTDLNGNDLRKLLSETLIGVKNGSIPINEATAISSLAREVLNTVKLQFDVSKFSINHKDLNDIKLLTDF